MSRAGVIALLLLGSAFAPVPVAAAPTAEARPGAVAGRLAPDLPAQPTEPPTPAEETPGGTTPEDDPGDDTAEDGPAATGVPLGAGDPLQVTITRLSPSTVPRRGPVTISGQLTNLSEEQWSDLTVYAATSATPITTEEELLAAEASPTGVEPADYQRLVEPDLYAQVGDLAPGESTSYRLTIPRRELGLPASPGVYRVGVQVLGTENGARAEGADGRARVLMASVSSAQRTPFALAVQMRRRTVRAASGEVDYVAGWQRTLGRQGRLRQVVRLLATAGDYPVSFVIDPALVEAAGSLAAGNTALDLTRTGVDGVDQETGAIAAEPPVSAEPAESDPASEVEELTSDEARTAADAISWLQELHDAADGRDVRAIPYGDLDLGAAARHGSDDLVGRSLASGVSLLSEYDIQATGIAAPYHGLLGQETADALPDGVPMLAARRSFVAAVVEGDEVQLLDTPAPAVPASLSGPDGAPIWTYGIVRTKPGTAAGVSALEMRQRILARGGVHAVSSPRDPLVVVLPPQWSPGPAWSRSDFFAGLRTPWLRPVPLDQLQPEETPVVEGERLAASDEEDATSGDAAPAEPGTIPGGEATSALALSYPLDQLESEVPPQVFRAARRLESAGGVLGGIVVADDDTVGPRTERQALLGLSFHTRGHVPGVAGRLRAADNIVSALLREIEVLAPRFVRMASENGSFLVPVVNGLDVPVRVQLRPEVAEPGLRLEVPEPVEVPAQGRQPIRVALTAEEIGIRSVRVDLVATSGERLYQGPTFSVRSSQVGRWVWVVMAVGSIVLFVAIAVRIYRRVRARRATHGPALQRVET